MAAGSRREETVNVQPEIVTHRTTQDRVVFTEAGNNDGWISSDVVVDLRS